MKVAPVLIHMVEPNLNFFMKIVLLKFANLRDEVSAEDIVKNPSSFSQLFSHHKEKKSKLKPFSI